MPDNKLKLGVMGFPVCQSRSPQMFRDTFAHRPDILSRYSYDLIEEDDFTKAFERFDREYHAVNVTAPFKEPAFKSANEASPLCRLVGASNLMIHQDGLIVAENTDILAVAQILRNWSRRHNSHNHPLPASDSAAHGQDNEELKVLVVGCGGAGKAAVVAALSVGASVTIANRTEEVTLRFIEHLQAHSEDNFRMLPGRAPLTDLPSEVRQADFIIHTLPIAIEGLGNCDFTGKTVLEAKYYDTAIKQSPEMIYISGDEWFRRQAVETYRILGLI